MRKLIWCSAAAAVLMAGGLFMVWQHARAHPDSLAGRCVVATSGAAIFLNPLAGAGPLVEHVVHHWAPAGGSEECVTIAPGDEAHWQEEPVCIGQEGDGHEAMRLEMAGVLELPAAEQPDGPAPIVIPEDDPPAPPADENGNVAPLAAPGIDIENEVSPLSMPYCEDGRAPAPAHMPYADEGEEPAGAADAAPAQPKCECLKVFFKKLFKKSEDQPAAAEAEDGETKGEGEADYHRYHPEHHSGCPANYCPYTGRCYPEPSSPHTKKSHGGEEDSEAPATHGKGCDKGEGCPKHPEVDTMEYRKSDGHLDDYGPGGPF
ncbi:MAG TPA: hypothetical protein VFE78_20985 [Gemmataceae bacterium]|jgi:hypothetical protein|nr:hypothetical protein [Gemmataceae bacterium]